MLPHEHTRHTRHAQRSKCLTKRSWRPLQNDVHDICLFKPPLSCSAGLLTSVAMGNHQGESREALLEMIMRYCRLREGGCGSSCHDRWVPCMTFACKGSAGAPCLHVQLSSHSGIAWRPAMPWVSLCSARPECRMTDESAVTDRGKFCRSQDLRFGPNGHRRQSFHDERNLKLGSSALSYDFLPVCSFHRPPFTPDRGPSPSRRDFRMICLGSRLRTHVHDCLL